LTKKLKPQKSWTSGEEAALARLKEDHVPMSKTMLGSATMEIMESVGNGLVNVSEAAITKLKAAIQSHKERNLPNAL
jgi:serine/threonine-protein kinase RIO1